MKKKTPAPPLAPVSTSTPTIHYVGIGASAGGLKRSRVSLLNMLPDSGMAFIVAASSPWITKA